jgi:hypothetical protein
MIKYEYIRGIRWCGVMIHEQSFPPRVNGKKDLMQGMHKYIPVRVVHDRQALLKTSKPETTDRTHFLAGFTSFRPSLSLFSAVTLDTSRPGGLSILYTMALDCLRKG